MRANHVAMLALSVCCAATVAEAGPSLLNPRESGEGRLRMTLLQSEPLPPPPFVETPVEPSREPPPLPADAPTVESPTHNPPSAERFADQASLVPPAGGGSLAAFVLVGVPLTWLAATVPAFAVGAISYFVFLAMMTSNQSVPSNNYALVLPPAFAVGALVGVGITYFMLPWVMKAFGDDKDYVGSSDAARDRGWELGRWPLLVAIAGLAITTVGIHYQNSTVSSAGLIVTGVGYTAAWGFDVYGVIEGYNRSRVARTRP